jgi:hypothetical protein
MNCGASTKPELLGEFVVGGGADFAGYSWLANTIRSLAPMARKLGVSLEPLGDLDTLTERLRSEAVTEKGDCGSPPYVGAFVRVASRHGAASLERLRTAYLEASLPVFGAVGGLKATLA